PAELRIDDRRQLVEGELVSVAPGTEQLADIVDRRGCRFRWGPSMTAVLYCRARIGRRTIGRHDADHVDTSKTPFKLLVRKGGFEPPRSCDRQPLKLVRLPFRHFRKGVVPLEDELPMLLWRRSWHQRRRHDVLFPRDDDPRDDVRDQAPDPRAEENRQDHP